MAFQDFQSFDGDQIIYSSERLVLNARKDSLFLLSKKTVSLSAGEGVHIDVGDPNNKKDSAKLIVNAPTIQLGLPEHGDLQPIAKGEETTAVIDSLLNALNKFCTTMQTAVGIGVGTVDLSLVKVAANALGQDVNLIKKRVENIKSKTTYSI
jgi:hypothetical protein